MGTASAQNGKKGGRPRGTTKPELAGIRALAAQHGPYALERLVFWAGSSEGHVSVSATKELLDRGYGKAPQPHDGDGQGGPVTIIVQTGVPWD